MKKMALLISTAATIVLSAVLSWTLLFYYRPTVEIAGPKVHVRLNDFVVASLPLVIGVFSVGILVARFRTRHGPSN